MKKTLLLSLFLFASISGFSQDYLDKIATNTCNCTEKLSPSLSKDDFTMQFGLCMIAAASDYKKEIKKDYKLNMDNVEEIESKGEKLWANIAIKMATVCPKSFSKLADEGKDEAVAAVATSSLEGVVTQIEKNLFVTFYVKDASGKITKLYWLSFIESSLDLTTKYNTLLNKKVTFTYETKDFFDPKINDFRAFNIITQIQ